MINVYDHYRWRWRLQERGDDAFAALSRTPDWQERYFTTLRAESAFWLTNA